ncbi:glycosyltransferase family 2 protein [Leeuwenhoekiella aestuarii]|uniref:Glycosyltransferase involved in cell wall biosynthesis n=1 Tax=Leeuwenhoekiella aestuarii TaxID=2249426 RepID=A0A4Q0NRG9_9FLAO|nr:glycosyltransferase family A protein [Leeuwenhoekiella aestuarii]RXG12335.1 hypothetical protein DSM04_107106 [Leeuwenhoekiella aestuarii]
MNKPFVSIVIPCYNDYEYIEDAINYAIRQTNIAKEIIVVDDGSNQRTKNELSRLKPNIDVLITQKNKGLSAARNIGICRSKGEYILVWDSDDYFDITFCEKAVGILNQKYPEYKLVCSDIQRFNSEGAIDIIKPIGGNLRNFLFSNAAVGTSMFKKSDWLAVGGYDEKMKRGYEDWEFFIRLFRQSGAAYVIKEPLFNYRQKKESMHIEAKKIRFQLWSYIFKKHKDLYILYYDELVDFLLNKVEREEFEKIKNTKRLEYRIGYSILKPLRFIKHKLKL